MRWAVWMMVGVSGMALAQVDAPKPSASVPLVLRVLDGRNGQPVKDEQVSLWYDEREGRPVVLQTDERGEAEVPASPSPALRVLVVPETSVDCRKMRADAPPVAYSLRQIGERGVAAENGCGSVAYRKRAGELVLFVRSRRWYDGLAH